MSFNFNIGSITKLNSKKASRHLYFLLIYFSCWVYLTTVSFYVVNDENRIKNFSTINSTSRIAEIENKLTGWFIEEDKISLFKNNILCFKSGEETKYYNPTILRISYPNEILLNPIFSKTSFESKQTNIKIFLKDVSYSALLLFLKLIDNSDIIVNQIKIQDFLDILMIISVLDIEKSKERNIFLKELLRNFMFAMENGNEYFNFEKYCESYHYKHIKKSILMDLLIFFIDFITFDDKSAQRYIVSAERKLRFKNITKYFTSSNSLEKSKINGINLRLDDTTIRKLYRIMKSRYLIITWSILLEATNLNLLYLIFWEEEIYIKLVGLFSITRLHLDKLYIYYYENPMNIFTKKQTDIFTKNLKVLKIEFDSTPDELKKLLSLCCNVQKLTLSTKKFDFERLDCLINFSLQNPNINCKIYCLKYEFIDTEIDLLKRIPNNLVCYVDYAKRQASDIEIPIENLPFLRQYYYQYPDAKESSILSKHFEIYETIRFKALGLYFVHDSSYITHRDTIFLFLKHFNTIKYFSLRNIIICNELLVYILESNTIVCFTISNFVCAFNLKCILKNNIINRRLRSFKIENSLGYIDSSLLIFMSRLECMQYVKFVGIFVNNLTSYLERIYRYIFGSEKQIESKIYIIRLEIIEAVLANKSNILNFLSKIIDFTNLFKIIYRVNMITETEYKFFGQMRNLETVYIVIRNMNEYIDFKKLFINRNLFNTVSSLSICVSKILKEDIEILRLFKKLFFLSLSCEEIYYETILNIKKEHFKNTQFRVNRPIRYERSYEVNNYLDSEFNLDFL
ncbi:hypothetical protein CWI37_0216p0060 [Hamiltosporidium tvaerminnensis]|uniref:Uncharacterized protein n=1 Tax=Hamiltosporidium tvaerminnensis TaxID=1176355 RepID=A0A4Q9LAP9_9MICR|nr:hypothetical protein CWI37_0216p0060 [Hamiltosporidium tvaerminnensis]